MTVAVLELNDQNLLLQAADGSLHAEPGFARVTTRGIRTGERARASAWQEPQHGYNQYWNHLNQTPLAAREPWARHHADIAFAQLRSLWQAAEAPESLVVLVPASFSDEQLSLLLGLLAALPVEPLMIMDSALAACMAADRDSVHVDVQLHQTVVSRCRVRAQQVQLAEQEVFPDIGQMQIYNSLARHISQLMIDSARFDPLHASDTEQYIYDQAPVWLKRLQWEGEVSANLQTPKGELPFTLRQETLKGLLGERLRNLHSFVERHAADALLLSSHSALLAGLSPLMTDAEIAKADHATAQVQAQTQWLLSQVDERFRVREIQRERPTNAGQTNGRSGGRQATHVLYGDKAWSLRKPVSFRVDGGGLQVHGKLDDAATLTLVLRNRKLETLHREEGADAQLPEDCQPGQSLLIAGHALKLIEVKDG